MRPTARTVAALALGALAGPAAAPAEPPATVQERLGHPASARLLVLHADDLGMAHSVNRATFEALERGWVTSASILVPCPWFPEVARWARAHPEADLGIHLALNSEWTTFRWGPVSASSEVPSLLDPDGYFPLVEPTVVQQARLPEVERELRAQVDRARAAGIRITHLDSHMGTLFRTPELLGVFRKVAAEYGLPMLLERQGDGSGMGGQPDPSALVDRVVSLEPGVPIGEWPAAYERLLQPLPPGVYELILHLAHGDEEMRGATSDHPDWGAAWRQADLDLVKSRRFRDFLEAQGFVLVAWKDLAKAALPPAATAGALPAGKPR
jgi:predicted glycoside hydrolase/deacetylase ChbG (UPF0249 family)